ncbi:hypothetical protein H9L21_12275 [Aeromicrobium senzhongii]|uniref:Uncharacterized protein n=1 Tax=Aeromicrobium senzhongii TaxID=2663859 RepID=A0ABX6SS65_9ACTN|nr:hypothetical protein [Aeromicrobium senzhongii]MTB88846.1 hypothetical protein [Aeromicrobium senzhongii]QNL93866.1 hypothetical protein H9L21_12275 [Aeromicrobium senzhongii]
MSVLVAAVLVCLGIAGAALGLVAAAVDGVKHRDPDLVTDAFPWGYMGVGLVVGAAGFAFASLAASTDVGWSALRDAAPVLLVASAGYGVLHHVIERRLDRPISWVAPWVLSLALGVFIALALQVG